MKYKMGLRLFKPYDRRSVSIVFSHRHFFLIFTLLSLLLSTMVRTRSQLENLSKDKLIDEVLSLENLKNDIKATFAELNNPF